MSGGYTQPDFDLGGGGGGQFKGKPRRECCGSDTKQGWSLALQVAGLFLFGGLLLALYLNGPVLEQTGKATVRMENMTSQMNKDVETALKNFRSNFPVNQEVITTQQILDSIDKMHEMVIWAEGVRKTVSPEVVGSLVTNVEVMLRSVNGMMAPSPHSSSSGKTAKTAEEGQRDKLLGNTADMIGKLGTLLNTITAAEFHEAFKSMTEAVRNVNDVMGKLKQPQGLRLSFPGHEEAKK